MQEVSCKKFESDEEQQQADTSFEIPKSVGNGRQKEEHGPQSENGKDV